MFTHAQDRAAGVPIKNHPYPEGEAGIVGVSMKEVCARIREGAQTAVMKSYVGNLWKQAGFPESTFARVDAVNKHVKKVSAFAPDALGTEQIQTAAVTLCVEGAPICIPIRDCDDGIVAVGTLLAAGGLEVEVVRQYFGEEHQQHVILEVKDEGGKWIPVDPSAKTMGTGQKARAVRETRHSPWDDNFTGLDLGAQFVGIGGLPVYIWSENDHAWKHAKATAQGFGEACCSSCAEGKTCEGSCGDKHETAMQKVEDVVQSAYDRRVSGVGAPWPGVANIVQPFTWLKSFWDRIDPVGRGWDNAVQAAQKRAIEKKWDKSEVSVADFIVLVLSTSMTARAAENMPGDGARAAAALNRTWAVIAKKAGYNGQSIAEIREAAKKKSNPLTANAIEIGTLIVIAVAGVAIVGFVLYFAYQIATEIIPRVFAFVEMLWLQVQVQRILDKHLENPDLPWTDEERKMVDNLEALQQGAHATVSKPPSDPDRTSVWAYLGIATIVGGVVLAVVYRDELKEAVKKMVSPTPKKLKAA